MAGFTTCLVLSLLVQANAALTQHRSQTNGSAYVQGEIHRRMKVMTVPDAIRVLNLHHGTPKDLTALVQQTLADGVKHHVSASVQNARKHFRGQQKMAREDPSGYGG
eukprot:6480347-Amphidinium_carterae.1